MSSSPVLFSPYLMTGPAGARTFINNRELDYFCGTGYYNLHANPVLIQAACDATQDYGEWEYFHAKYGLAKNDTTTAPLEDTLSDEENDCCADLSENHLNTKAKSS